MAGQGGGGASSFIERYLTMTAARVVGRVNDGAESWVAFEVGATERKRRYNDFARWRERANATV